MPASTNNGTTTDRKFLRKSFAKGALLSALIMTVISASLIAYILNRSAASLTELELYLSNMEQNGSSEQIAQLRHIVAEQEQKIRDGGGEITELLDEIAATKSQIRALLSDPSISPSSADLAVPQLPDDWELDAQQQLRRYLYVLIVQKRRLIESIDGDAPPTCSAVGSCQGSIPTGAAETEPDTGRIIYHSPNRMLVDRPYFVEVLIRPIGTNDTAEDVDAALATAIGAGTIFPNESPLPTSTDDVSISGLMAASLQGKDYEIEALTPATQVVSVGDATRWIWSVTPLKEGIKPLTASVSQIAQIDGEERTRTIMTKVLAPQIRSLDTLLNPYPDELYNATGVAAQGSTATEEASSIAGLILRANVDTNEVADVRGCITHGTGKPSRLALVLSNQAYSRSVGKLKNTHEDGDRLSASLESVGYRVMRCKDLDSKATVLALATLAKNAYAFDAQPDNADEELSTFFYYSGHGVNVSGSNYLIPIDAKSAKASHVESTGVIFEDILDRVWIPDRSITFVVFDACRTIIGGTKGVQIVPTPAIGSGLYQAFATGDGKPAADDGIYSKELAPRISSSTSRAEIVFDEVQLAVSAQTGKQQIPSNRDDIADEFYFLTP